MPLTEVAIKALKPGDKIARYYDENGLYLEISPAGGKWWRIKYRFAGKEKRLSLGVYPEVSLKAARVKRDELRQQIQAGNDPAAMRKHEKAAAQRGRSFEDVAREWWEHWKVGKTDRYADYAIKRLVLDVFPEIGAGAICDLTTRQIVACVRKIEARGCNDLAHKQLNKISQVFRYAIAHDLAERNPAADISPSDILKPLRHTNVARIKAAELPQLIRAMDAYDGDPLTRAALQLMLLTFVRTGELIGARWAEFDGALWRIPAERMKMKTPHLVPLSRQALGQLDALRKVSGASDYLFPGRRLGAMSNNTILYALYRMGYRGKMTGHGFRGLASTILHEQGWEHEHIELQLAHTDRDQVSAAYNHALYLEPRARMMQAWADFIDAQRAIAGAWAGGK